jgi:hypothetical protein
MPVACLPVRRFVGHRWQYGVMAVREEASDEIGKSLIRIEADW